MSLTSSSSNRNSTKCRIVFLGDQGVGKSSIIDRYTTNRFDETHNNTVGIDFNVKDVTRCGHVYRLQMWDTAGQQRYRSLIPTYLKNAQLVVHVFDVTKRQTLQGIRNWNKLFLQHQQAPGIIVANKTDLTAARQVSRQEGEALAAELRLGYSEVSAKTGKKINEVFEQIVDMISNEMHKEQQMVESSRQKMKPIEQESKQQTQKKEEDKGISLKARGIALAKKLNCCTSS